MDPGKTHTYIWEIQQNQGPMDGDSSCLTYSYSSNTDSVKDINSGLIGALLVCRPGKDRIGWGQVTCNHGSKSRKIKDAFQSLKSEVYLGWDWDPQPGLDLPVLGGHKGNSLGRQVWCLLTFKEICCVASCRDLAEQLE